MHQTKEKTSSKQILKQDQIVHKVIELAKERNYCLERLFAFELTPEHDLYNEDGSLKKEKPGNTNCLRN